MKTTLAMALTLALILLYAACAHGQTAPKPHAIWAPYSASMPTATLQARYDALQREIDNSWFCGRLSLSLLSGLIAEQEPIRQELDRRDIAQIHALSQAIEGKRKP